VEDAEMEDKADWKKEVDETQAEREREKELLLNPRRILCWKGVS
jgi:hypothetical protein